jgi:hypothetical protein
MGKVEKKGGVTQVDDKDSLSVGRSIGDGATLKGRFHRFFESALPRSRTGEWFAPLFKYWIRSVDHAFGIPFLVICQMMLYKKVIEKNALPVATSAWTII